MGIQEAKKNGSPINDFGDDIFVDFEDVRYLYFTMIPVKANRPIYFKI